VIWVAIDVTAAVLGLAVLALVALRLWRQVRDLGRQVRAAGDQIAAATAELDRVTPGPAAGHPERPPGSRR